MRRSPPSLPAIRPALGVAWALAAAMAAAGCPAGGPTGMRASTAVQVAASPAARKSPTPSPTPTPDPRLSFEVLVKAPADPAVAAGPPWAPRAGLAVALELASSGRPLPDATPTTTDAEGRVRFKVKPPGGPVVVTAQVGAVRLLRIYAIVEGGKPVVDPATTLVAAWFRTTRIDGVDAVDRVDAPRAEGLATKARLKLEADAAGVDLTSEVAAAQAFQAMMDADPALAGAVKAALGGTKLGEDPLADAGR